MAISNYLENKILNHTLNNVPYTQPEVVYLALFKSDPTDDNIGDVNSIRYKGYYVDAATGFSFYHKNIYNVINLNDVNLIEMFDPMSWRNY